MEKTIKAIKRCKDLIGEIREKKLPPAILYEYAIELAANRTFISSLAIDCWEEARFAEELAKNKENDIYEETKLAEKASIKDTEVKAKQATKELRKDAIKKASKARKLDAFMKNVDNVISTIQTKISFLKTEKIDTSLPEASK